MSTGRRLLCVAEERLSLTEACAEALGTLEGGT